MEYSTDVLDLIGATPLVKLNRVTDMSVFAKAEIFNPGGSIKDRVAKHIIFTAEREGELRPGQLIVETRLVETDPDRLEIGMPVELALVPFRDDDQGPVHTYAFVRSTP